MNVLQWKAGMNPNQMKDCFIVDTHRIKYVLNNHNKTETFMHHNLLIKMYAIMVGN